jgi:hypothetical protein
LRKHQSPYPLDILGSGHHCNGLGNGLGCFIWTFGDTCIRWHSNSTNPIKVKCSVGFYPFFKTQTAFVFGRPCWMWDGSLSRAHHGRTASSNFNTHLNFQPLSTKAVPVYTSRCFAAPGLQLGCGNTEKCWRVLTCRIPLAEVKLYVHAISYESSDFHTVSGATSLFCISKVYERHGRGWLGRSLFGATWAHRLHFRLPPLRYQRKDLC